VHFFPEQFRLDDEAVAGVGLHPDPSWVLSQRRAFHRSTSIARQTAILAVPAVLALMRIRMGDYTSGVPVLRGHALCAQQRLA
jgi:hypothetical protein